MAVSGVGGQGAWDFATVAAPTPGKTVAQSLPAVVAFGNAHLGWKDDNVAAMQRAPPVQVAPVRNTMPQMPQVALAPGGEVMYPPVILYGESRMKHKGGMQMTSAPAPGDRRPSRG